MNYAATLAVLVVLAFSFPVTVRLSAQAGIPEALFTTLVGVIFTFFMTAYLVRWKVNRHSLRLTRLSRAREQVIQDPNNPTAYFVEGEHLAIILLRMSRRREAADIIDRYSRVGGAKESEIIALREALSQAERRKRRDAEQA